jgi:hypothetical protein
MSVEVLFYQGRKPEDCFIIDVFEARIDAVYALLRRGWQFNTERCVWCHEEDPKEFVEILEKEVH